MCIFRHLQAFTTNLAVQLLDGASMLVNYGLDTREELLDGPPVIHLSPGRTCPTLPQCAPAVLPHFWKGFSVPVSLYFFMNCWKVRSCQPLSRWSRTIWAADIPYLVDRLAIITLSSWVSGLFMVEPGVPICALRAPNLHSWLRALQKSYRYARWRVNR